MKDAQRNFYDFFGRYIEKEPPEIERGNRKSNINKNYSERKLPSTRELFAKSP